MFHQIYMQHYKQEHAVQEVPLQSIQKITVGCTLPLSVEKYSHFALVPAMFPQLYIITNEEQYKCICNQSSHTTEN